MTKHDKNCRWDNGRGEPCRKFSTDGTRLGAAIAHQMGTTNEDEILEWSAIEDREARYANLTGMREEQADWEADA